MQEIFHRSKVEILRNYLHIFKEEPKVSSKPILPLPPLLRWTLAGLILTGGAAFIKHQINSVPQPSLLKLCHGETPGFKSVAVSIDHKSNQLLYITLNDLNNNLVAFSDKEVDIYESSFPYGATVSLVSGNPLSDNSVKLASEFVSPLNCPSL